MQLGKTSCITILLFCLLLKKNKTNYTYLNEYSFLFIKFMEISQKIIDYAIWYYLRYYPSPKKLELKLKMKF